MTRNLRASFPISFRVWSLCLWVTTFGLACATTNEDFQSFFSEEAVIFEPVTVAPAEKFASPASPPPPLNIAAMDVAQLPTMPSAPAIVSERKTPVTTPSTSVVPEPSSAVVPVAFMPENDVNKHLQARDLKFRLREQLEQQKNPAPAARHNPASVPDASLLETHTAPHLLLDDMDKDGLIQVLENQIKAMEESGEQDPVKIGSLWVQPQRLKDSLNDFLKLVQLNLPPEEFSRRVHDEFIFFEAGKGKNRKMTFTGYYTPVIKASRFQTDGYNYPLYYQPDNMLNVVLVDNARQTKAGEYHSAYQARNYTREEIDNGRVLANKNLEIAWLQSDMERYFLHIQGSGMLTYINGATESIQYLGSNGYPYESIGKMMIQDGAITPGEGSMQGIKSYFRRRPQDIPKYVYKNKRYIFFKLSGDMPRGSGGGEVVAHRSIATDKKIYPHGGLAFIIAKKPVLDENNEITRWEMFSRFVVDQDTGNAIRGPGRADLYFGIGDRAGSAAGHYKQEGKIFYLLKK